MEPDENNIETTKDSKINEIIERSNTQSRILKKVLTELNSRTKQDEAIKVKSSKKKD